MSKSVSFNDKDEELIKRIEKYQQENNIRHFIDAIRDLCDVALTFKEISK